MAKVSLVDKRVFKIFLQISSGLFAALSAALIFIDIPDGYRAGSGIAVLVILLVVYIAIWCWSNNLHEVSLSIDGSTVNIMN